jgi:hypothetical protein
MRETIAAKNREPEAKRFHRVGSVKVDLNFPRTGQDNP